MGKYAPISTEEAKQIEALSARLGTSHFRALMTTSPSGGRMRPIENRRLSKWTAGHGTLSQSERERLNALKTNSTAIQNLLKKNSGKQSFRVNRAIRDWISAGKGKGIRAGDKDKEQKAIKALRYLGVEPSDGTYYVRKRKG